MNDAFRFKYNLDSCDLNSLSMNPEKDFNQIDPLDQSFDYYPFTGFEDYYNVKGKNF